MAEVQTQQDYPRGLNFEQVWAALMENRELQKETDRLQKENALRQKETDRQMKETDRQIKEINKRFGDFSNRFGEIAEYMVAPGLQDKFRKMGLTFQEASNHAKYRDDDNNIFFEVDIMLENGDKAMLVEVKTKPSTEDVQDHIQRLEKMRTYADLRGDKRSFLGAVAGVAMTKNVRDYVLKQGFYVIEPSGETFNITPPNGQPKEW
ncbi:MAG: hypothetical protein FWG07_08830 [Treponema sp.]|nr:hypothetical protein [Treponema sp.]